VRQLAGAERIAAALERGEVELVLAREGAGDPRETALLDRAKQLGVAVRTVSAGVLRRLSLRQPPADLLALVGRAPRATLDELLAGPGAAWLLVGTSYPGNAGFAIRTAEVSGADGVVIDAAFDRERRRDALRLSMRADWFMPVLWHPALPTVERARELGRRVVAVECTGSLAPWQADLGGRVLFVVGAESGGVPEPVLERADLVLRVPMAGFIPTYNLQAALAAVAIERLRQLER
jgi:tRNA G18 (ribose-2'-O)-methylase SpoU